MQKQYEKRADIHPCAFDANGLVQLGDVITDDITNLGVPVEVEITLVDGRTSLDNYAEFPQHANLLRNATEIAFTPRSTDTDEKYHSVQRIYLTLTRTGIRLNIMGNNENWVIGNFERIKNFLDTKRPRLWYRTLRFMYLPTFTVSVPLAMGNLSYAIIYSIIYAIKNATFFLVSGALFSILALLLFLSLGKFFDGGILPYVVYETSLGGSDISPVDKTKILLALLTLVAAVIAMLIAVLTLFIPLPIRHS